MAEWEKWKHITKLDPDKKVSDKIIKTIVDSGTDAIMISGTQRISKEKVQKLVSMLKPYSIPKVLEPVGPESIVYNGIDYIFVPSVFNTNNPLWINGLHKFWAKMDKNINWDIVVPEAYIILNPNCSAFRKTNAYKMSKEDAVAAAIAAERYFNFPVIYIEYSGVYGDPKLVEEIRSKLTKAHLLYGGGIDTARKAKEMGKYATIVVGNTIYENGTHSFMETVTGSVEAFYKKIHDAEKKKLNEARKALEEKLKELKRKKKEIKANAKSVKHRR